MRVQANEDGQGYAITFDNGYTLSVQWKRNGVGVDNYAIPGKSVEIAAWKGDGPFIYLHGQTDQMVPYVPFEDIGKYMKEVAEMA